METVTQQQKIFLYEVHQYIVHVAIIIFIGTFVVCTYINWTSSGIFALKTSKVVYV